MSDIVEIKRALVDRAQDVAEYLLPRGVRSGREWCVGSIHGEAGQSLKICVAGTKAGTFADFASGGESGDLIDLWGFVKHVGLVEALKQIRDWLGMRLPEFEKPAKTYRRPAKPKCKKPASAVLAYLTQERKLSVSAIRAYKVAEADRTIVLPSLLPEDGALAFVKYLNIDRSTEGKKVTRVEPGCEPVLFGWQAIDPEAREVTITEGEIDAMSSWDYGFPAMSVPFGGGSGAKHAWIETEYERLLRFEVIYLALDMDKEGDTAAAAIADRLGTYRCRRVHLPHKDLNECKQAGMTAEDVRGYFEAAENLDPPELVRPIEYLDEVIRLFWPPEGHQPGYALSFTKIGDKVRFRPGELTEWTGSTDAGKSQLLSYVLLPMAVAGAKVCAASFEMPGAQFLRRMVKQAGNVDRPTRAYIEEVMRWIDSWMWLWKRQGKAPVKRIIEVFEHARRRYGCDVFVIDSLMRLGIGSEDYDGQEKAVFELVNWVLEKGVHLHLVAHARKVDKSRGNAGVPDAEDIKGTSEIANNAANIVSVWRNRKLEDELRQAAEAVEKGEAEAEAKLAELRSKPTVMMNIAKQRNGDWEGKVGLWFDLTTYQYRTSHDERHGRTFITRAEQVELNVGAADD